VRRQEEEEGGDVGVKLRELSMRRMEKKFTVARANVLKILKNLDAESDDAESLYEQLNFNNYYRN
jgi:Fe2+ or Zn2+ uptake regulation protein